MLGSSPLHAPSSRHRISFPDTTLVPLDALVHAGRRRPHDQAI
jgi:hypothetical protein